MPLVFSAVFVFIASPPIRMVPRWHNTEFQPPDAHHPQNSRMNAGVRFRRTLSGLMHSMRPGVSERE
jgi:hypothetical protein